MSDRSSIQKFKRKLTPFLCQEMLYDYATDLLDEERKAAVGEYLKTDRECQTILDQIHRAFDYSDRLSETRISPETLTLLKDAENVVSLGRRYSSWSEWPEAFRWSVTALGISSVVALTIVLIPWSKIPFPRSTQPSNEIRVADLSRPDGAEEVGESGHTEAETGADAENKEIETSGDEYGEEAPATETAAAGAVPTRPAGHSNVDPAPQAVTEPPSEPEQQQTRREVKPAGYVYRAFMALPNLEVVGTEIADRIKVLGGEKAGEVEIGWKRGSGRYYHFAMPEENEAKLMEQLQAYGPVRISKDPHPRVMPKGQIRIILWIESAG